MSRHGPSTAQIRIPFRADVEGLRAVAVILVVAFHARVPGVSGGFIGVDVFFVISGYLITKLLVEELDATGTIGFLRFYARRARRLLPAAIAASVATIFAGSLILAPLEMDLAARAAIASSAYVSNLWFMQQGLNYFAGDTQANPFLHTWSLSVEEQFYLFWPAILLVGWVFLRGRTSRVLVLLACCILSFAICLWLARVRQPWAFYLLPARAWEFGAGALASFVCIKGLELSQARIVRWAGLAMIVGTAVFLDEHSPFPGWTLLIPILGTCAILSCGESRGSSTFWPLTNPPMQIAGSLSYSIYLWHWPTLVLGVALFPDTTTTGRLGLVALSVVAAAASYHVLENPIRRSPWLAQRVGHAIALGGCLSLFGVALGLGSLFLAMGRATDPAQIAITTAAQKSSLLASAGNCLVGFETTEPRACTFGDADAEGTVVLLGDSHAAQWFSAVHWVASQHKLRTVTFLKASCPIVDADVYNARLLRSFHECRTWRTAAVEKIIALNPRLVVVSSHQLGYVPGLGRHSAAMTISPEDWASGVQRSLRTIADKGIPIAYMRDTPRIGSDVPNCLARATTSGVSTTRCGRPLRYAVDDAAFARERSALSAVAEVRVVDMTEHFCDQGFCPPIRDGLIVYRDTNHVSEDYVRSLQVPLAKELRAVATKPSLNISGRP